MIEGGGYLSDPGQIAVVSTAVRWFTSAMLGTLASVIAVLAIAAVGLLMLSGHLNLRRGVVTISGCFVLFGSSVIATALLGLSGSSKAAPTSAVSSPPPALTPSVNSSGETYDPYAGAPVPADH